MNVAVLLLACLVSLFSMSEQSDEICLPLRRDADSSSSPTPEIVQGRPGKLGPPGLVGPVGPQGIRGPPGECTCDPRDFEELRENFRELQDKVERLALYVNVPISKKVELCSVGVRDGRVPDDAMTASSVYSKRYTAKEARLDSAGARVWISPRHKQRKGEWIQIDLGEATLVTGVVTQGRHHVNAEWVTGYKIQFGNSTNNLDYVTNRIGEELVFPGNVDMDSYVINTFPRPLVARYFRLVVETWNNYISLRLDYITC